jgi:hypothetical protein
MLLPGIEPRPSSPYSAGNQLLMIFFCPISGHWDVRHLWHDTPAHSVTPSQNQSYVTTEGHSASLCWCQAPIWVLRPYFYFCQTFAGLLMWGALFDERMGLSFTISVGPYQRSHSQAWVPRDSWPHFTVSGLRPPQPGGPGPCIYIPQEQGDPVIPPGTGFSFGCLLRLSGLRWRYSTPPPHGISTVSQSM